ncbi:UBX domain-containing protein 1 [Strongylocentrotus purpuratus]|uniref:UBX domain-containing protein 1 n=1 Tax=Strongylocentrotus purpuratus TaxID=7668 RepID=A0A7M7TGE3_STRPU|nr:UBX domain-containing protein 1 [Strongylocentrotus purpuratus]|eukprot:XP_784876.1 PREDICTED: UBX domain-containing protein 1 [Strongylocentrotus purpuratus]
MPTDVDTLMEMGFPRNRAEKALAKTAYKGVQNAMDWLFAHNDDADIDDPFEVPAGKTLGTSESDSGAASGDSKPAGETPAEPVQVKSIKCDECGKKLRTPEDIQVHAGRTGHQSFSESTEEIKPLTEEEKKEQLAKLQERLKQKQLERVAKEKQEVLDKEKMRRKQGKQMVQAKQQHDIDEAKLLAAKKKKEKNEEKLARQRVKEQIACDRADRAARAAMKHEGVPPAQPPAAPAPAPVPATSSTAPKKEYDTTRLQVRLSNGSTITQSFGAMEPLAAVRVYIELNRTDGQTGAFSLMTPFPRKVFTSEDMEKPLKELGLVPSAVLTITRPQ